MIAFGTAVTDPEMYSRVGRASIDRVAEPDSVVLVREGFDSIQEPYNELLDEATALPGLEALVLLHQDIELTDDSLLERARPLLSDPRTGAIGPLGWRGMDLHRWSESGERLGRSVGPGVDIHHSAGPVEVEILDGVLLVLAPWVVRSVRFDPRFATDFHGYDADFSMRVRAAGGRLFCSDLPYHHHMARPWRDRAQFIRASVALARMWDPALRPLEWAPDFRGGPG